jgi:predicted AAA+ superfamily ATPase
MALPYMPRVIDALIDERLEYTGAVLIDGIKWCGKTRTAKEKVSSGISFFDKKKGKSYIKLAGEDPSILLEGDTPRLIDEWQAAPEIWNAVKYEVDERSLPGQFILTGSAAPEKDPSRHSGAGRISSVTMRPMSLFESMESNGSISLRNLFDHEEKIRGRTDLDIKTLASALVRGGWPALINASERSSMIQVRDFVKQITDNDVSKIDGVQRSPETVRQLMRSLSRNVSTAANMSTIRKDMMGDDDAISEKTISSYINALRRIFVVEDLPAWNPSLRSKSSVRSSPKRHFTDPSIATAVLRTSPSGLLEDFNTFGLLFESLCVRDLRVYAQANDGEVFHYRDNNGLEADAIVHLGDDRWGAVEVKMGSKEIDEGAANLKKLRDMIDTDRMKAPSFLMVLTATEYAYEDDGVHIVPIGCLKD